jgi:SAM-dependent methyltransferase
MTDAARRSPLLDTHLPQLRAAAARGPVLDLACGSGRNGLFLAQQGLPVVFADRSGPALASVRDALRDIPTPCELWEVDLEGAAQDPFEGRTFGAVLVFRYLHRPLFPALRAAVAPGGLVVYETFTVANRPYGRPQRAEFLLQPHELRARFAGWRVLHSFEGHLPDPDRAVAQLVCQAPD